MMKMQHHQPQTSTEGRFPLANNGQITIIGCNKTRQGHARKRILKLAGYLFSGGRFMKKHSFSKKATLWQESL